MSWNKIYRRDGEREGTWLLIFCDEVRAHLCTDDERHQIVPVDLDDALQVREVACFLLYNLGNDVAAETVRGIISPGRQRLRAARSPASEG